MYVHLVVGIHNYKIVFVAFVVAEEKVFAKCGAFAAIEFGGHFDGGSFGMLVVVVGDAHVYECLVDLWLTNFFHR